MLKDVPRALCDPTAGQGYAEVPRGRLSVGSGVTLTEKKANRFLCMSFYETSCGPGASQHTYGPPPPMGVL